MKRWMLSRVLCAMLLAAGAMAVVDCADNGPGTRSQEEMGTVSMPLITTMNGHTYQLSSMYIHIWGPSYASLSTGGAPDVAVLSTMLRTGDYTAELNNWRLERADEAGVFRPVTATLLNSRNYFTIANGATTTLVFQFETDGVIVLIGAGRLDVKVAVREVAPVCTPFGPGCSVDSWCPPAGLTGEALSCRSAGTVALGGACYAPGECVAKASCLDLGNGPVCTELCPSTDFGTPCSGGGMCLRCRADYGVCMQPVGDAGLDSSPPSSVCPLGYNSRDASVDIDTGIWW